MTAARIAKIGDNSPPTLEEDLKEKNKEIFERTKKWVKTAEKLAAMEPKTLEDCAILDRCFNDGKNITNDAATLHERAKKPFLEDGRTVDKVFNTGVRDVVGVKGGLAEKLNAASAKLQLKLTRDRQAAEEATANKLREQAEKAEAAAAAKAGQGKTTLAEVDERKADALHTAADQAEGRASQSVSEASKTTNNGVTSSVVVKRKVTAVMRTKLDAAGLAAIAQFIPEADLIKAAQKWVDLNGSDTLAGVVTEEAAKVRTR